MRFVVAGAFVVIAVAVAVAVAVRSSQTETAAPAATTAAPATTTSTAPPTTVPPMLGNALALTDLDGWLQTDVTSLEDLRGQVVIVQFWTFGCYNCKNTIPHLQDIYAEHHDRGLEIVGVHAPEFAYEEDPAAILAAAEELGVTWPIALDTERRNFRSWQGSPAYWPRTYVLDQNGLIRFDHIGEGAYDDLEQTVAALLAG
ncbi:MAG: redoxin domain-containing protein [Acidimicrobiia bacterium]|nr:redoxin domain-containing protein [Acidimicrobiia bacterium]